jgi:hypothetical protein
VVVDEAMDDEISLPFAFAFAFAVMFIFISSGTRFGPYVAFKFGNDCADWF